MSSPVIEREEEEINEQEKNEIVQENTVEKPVENKVEKDEVVIEKPEYSTKAVKKLSKDERAMLMSKFDRHEEDPYFKVIRMADGGIRITKRKIPLNTNIKEVQKMKSEAIENKYKGRLTNEQLIMEHIFDLETRFEAMRLKHKKLKKRYNELESAIYEDVDNEMKVEPKVEKDVEPQVEQQPEPQAEPQAEQQPKRSQDIKAQISPRKRVSWRDMIQYM